MRVGKMICFWLLSAMRYLAPEDEDAQIRNEKYPVSRQVIP